MDKASLLPPRANPPLSCLPRTSPPPPPLSVSVSHPPSFALPLSGPHSTGFPNGDTLPCTGPRPSSSPCSLLPLPSKASGKTRPALCLLLTPRFLLSAHPSGSSAPRWHSTRMTKGFRTCRCKCHLPAGILFTSQQQQQRASPWQLLRTAWPLGFRCPPASWLPSSCSFAHFGPSPREKGGPP